MMSRRFVPMFNLFVLCAFLSSVLGSDVSASGLTSDPAWTYNSPPIWQKKTAAEQARDVPITLQQIEAEISDICKSHGIKIMGAAIVDVDGVVWFYGENNHSLGASAGRYEKLNAAAAMHLLIGLSIMFLVERGELSLGDNVRDLAPEVQFDNPWDSTHPVKLADLIEDTTGWDGMHYAERYRDARDPADLLYLLNDYTLSRKSRWPPGTRRSAGTAGALVAAYIVEKKTGKDFMRFAEETFLKPLGFDSISLNESTELGENILLRYPLLGGFLATTENMAALTHLFVSNGMLNGQPLLKASSIARLEVSRSTLGSVNGDVMANGPLNVSGYLSYGVPFFGRRASSIEISYSPTLGKGFYISTDKRGKGVKVISRVIKKYLLQNYKFLDASPHILPEYFSEMTGYFRQISGFTQRNRFMVNLIGVIKISATEDRLQRIPLMGDHPADEFYVGTQSLINGWRGLPVLTILKDPIAGEVLQALSTYKKTSPFVVYSKLAFITLLSLSSIVALVYAAGYIVWATYRGKPQYHMYFINVIPGMTALIGVVALTMLSRGPEVYDLGRVSFISLSLYCLSGLYAIFSCVSLAASLNGFLRKRKLSMATIFGFSIMQFLFMLYLVDYGLVFMKTWQM